MGSCLSKKSVCASSTPVALPDPPEKLKSEAAEEETVVKKEIFVIKHRTSHEVERQKPEEEKGEIEKVEEIIEKGNGLGTGGGGGGPVRTSSCTKEEVDAILIQCGRLSRSSSTGKAALSSENGGRKYSGSKRSYDFDNENGKDGVDGDDEAVARERENRRRERRRNSQGRRRTPSREREKEQASQQRSGSRERGGGGRRVSRSPGRRSESPMSSNAANSNPNSSGASANCRPGKMVSVPATISSLGAMDKSSNGGESKTGAVKRIEVKRNVGGEGGGRSTASPRARSPARVRATATATNEDKPITLSRSNSRKAEISPFRRNPLGEIDNNVISQRPNSINISKVESNNQSNVNSKNQEQQHLMTGGHVVGMNVISSGNENSKTTTLTRTRSSRLSRELDIAPETLSNPNASYTALLLEDIQNFHQKNTPPPPFSLPPCLTKACSILEAVADLNSSNPITEPRKAKPDIRDPIVESEVVVNDDLMQPSFHKYVTVRRGAASGEEEDLAEQESSGSNSFAGNQQQWLSSSCWEPNSAESTDRWTTSSSSRTVSRQNDVSPVGLQRLTTSETVRGADGGGKKVSSVKKRGESDHQQSGIGRGRIAARDSHIAAST